MSYHAKQIKAIKLAIETLQRERRRLYAAGNAAYYQGFRTDRVNKNDVVGELFVFAEAGHENYKEYSCAIQELEDLIDILQDTGVMRDQKKMF